MTRILSSRLTAHVVAVLPLVLCGAIIHDGPDGMVRVAVFWLALAWVRFLSTTEVRL